MSSVKVYQIIYRLIEGKEGRYLNKMIDNFFAVKE